MPGLPPKLWTLLNCTNDMLEWENSANWNILLPGKVVHKGEPLFPRIDISQWIGLEGENKMSEDQTMIRVSESEKDEDRKSGVSEANSSKKDAEGVDTVTFEPIKEEIGMDDFAKLDLRVVKILKAERVEKTDKLLKLEVELAGEVRTVVSGIAEHYAPEDLINRHVILIANPGGHGLNDLGYTCSFR